MWKWKAEMVGGVAEAVVAAAVEVNKVKVNKVLPAPAAGVDVEVDLTGEDTGRAVGIRDLNSRVR